MVDEVQPAPRWSTVTDARADDIHSSRFSRTASVAIAVVLAAAGFAIAWYRLPAIARGTVWAEDGAVFLHDALTAPPLAHLFQGYSGYQQLVPRLLAAWAVVFGGPAGAATAMSAVSCAVAGLIAALVFACSRDVLGVLPLRILAALITVLAPLLPIEVLGNAANIHTLLLWGMGWALLFTPRSRTVAILLGLFGLAVAMSEIQAIVLLPLFLTRIRMPLVWPPRIGLALGLIVQLITELVSPRHVPHGALPSPQGVLRAYVLEVLVGGVVANERTMTQLERQHTLYLAGVAVAAAIPFVIGLVLALRRGSRQVKVAAIAFAAGSVLVFALDLYVNHWGGPPHAPAAFVFSRYAIAPSLCLLALLLVGAAALLRPHTPASHARTRHPQRALAAVLAAFALALMLVYAIPAQTDRDHGPLWSSQIRVAQEHCAKIGAGSAAVVIRDAPQGWATTLTCRAIR